MNINEVFPSKYLKASDLRGHVVKVKIARVDVEKVGQTDTKPVLYFQGKDKGLVLNKSKAGILAAAFSPETDGWIGKDIELRPDKVKFGDQIVDSISVQLPAPVATEDAPW